MNAVASFLLARMAEAQLALTLLTRLPAGKCTCPGPSLAASSWAFPLVGLVVGGIAAIVLYGALWFRLPPAIAAGLALAAGLLATGGLHDTKADTHSGAVACDRRNAPGMIRGSPAKSSAVRTSIRTGVEAVPISLDNFSTEMEVYDDIAAPSL